MSLVAHYPMDEGTGSTSSAAIGGWGDMTGVPGWGTHGNGWGACITVDGTGADLPNVPAATTYSLTVWVNVASAPGSYSSILEGGGFFLEHNQSRALDVWLGIRGINGGTIPAGEWHHIAVVSDGTTVTLYQDGAAAGTASATGTSLPAGAYKVGGSTSQPGDMSVDDLRIYDHALTTGELADVMTAPEQPEPEPTGVMFGDGTAAQPYLMTATGLVPLTVTGYTAPVGGGGGDIVATIASDAYGDHDAVPRGVPTGYSWRLSADTDPDTDYLGFNDYEAINVWGQCFATATTTGYAARLQVRDPRVWFFNGTAWSEASLTAGDLGGAYYPGDFQSGSVSASITDDGAGVYGVPLSGLDGDPDAAHFWWNGMFPRIVIPDGTLGILVRQEMRLTGDTTGANVIASTGADLFATPATVVDPQGWNDGIPNPRMKWVTDQWQTFYDTTVSLDTLTAHPPVI